MGKIVVALLERVIRRYKNPLFSFDENISLRVLLGLVVSQLIMRVRSFLLLARGRYIKGLCLGHSVSFRNLHLIKIGPECKLSEGVVCDGLGSHGLFLGARCSIGAYSRLIVSTNYAQLGGCIRIGNDVGIGEFSYIGGAGGVAVGDGCIIGQYLSVHPENHDFSDHNKPIRYQGLSRKGIEIGRNVWIGAKVTILDGAVIGDDCVVAAGSVVRSGIYSSYSILAGVPAKKIGSR